MRKVWKLCLLSVLLFGNAFVSTKAQEAFTIENLNIEINVNEDGTYEVKEQYMLDFSDYRHGFFRSIPTTYEMEWVNAESGQIDKKTYYFPVKDVSCGETACSIDSSNESTVIRLGDENREVIGEQRYEISYTIHSKDLDYHEAQMFYWNLIGNNFDTQVKAMTYQIQMPKSFDANEISVNTGRYHENGKDLSAVVHGNRIEGELLAPLSNYESATINVNLPNGYFSFPPPQDYMIYAIGITLLLLAFAGVLFVKYGKDDEVFVTVEFKAPEGLNSAGVGFVVDNMVDNKDIISLIIDWANRGYIMIHDENNHMKLEKIKEMDIADTTSYERIFYNGLFSNGKTLVDEEDMKQEQVSKGLNKAKLDLSNYFTKNKERRVYTSSSLALQGVVIAFLAISSLVCGIAAFYMHYELMSMSFPAIILAVICGVVALPWLFLMRKRYVLNHATYLLLWCLLFALNIVAYTITAVFILKYSESWIYASIFCISEIIMLLFMMFMDKRTKQGNRWLGQIIGLREFIVSCEKEKLEMLVEENPSAFYEILPYAYVLGVSDVWAKKFEDIIMSAPDWFQSSTYGSNVFTSYLWWGYFNRSFHNVSTAATHYQANSGTGGSSGFGGGSFGGGGFGGGFSGGGFGGGGGGSW